MPPESLSHFRLADKLGEGGMGEVYRATDERLGREVAIKILPASLTRDAERLQRMEREARILAALSHPNIAGLYDIGESDGVHYLVMELASGHTLEERLRAGALPQDEALGMAVQIARALEAAHEGGIVHRDLKPGNVMVDEADRVKLLDFGLAKAIVPEPVSGEGSGSGSGSGSLEHSPTMTSANSVLGMILGTAGYMSPEQARGKPVDKRADVWAFGVLLYEMLTGRRLFAGETVSDVMAAVLRAEIGWEDLPDSTPRSLRNVLRRCLVRDPDNRLRDIADVRIVLEEIQSGDVIEEQATDAAPKQRSRSSALWLAVAFLAGAAALWAGTRMIGAPASEPDALHMTHRQLTLLPGAEMDPAIAPDGESFLFVRWVDGQRDLFLQRVDGQNAINLTENCKQDDASPAWSPDGRRIAFRSECLGGGVFVMGAMGASSRKVTDEGFTPGWSPDGAELVVAEEDPVVPWDRSSDSRLHAVDVETGERRLVTDHDAVDPAWSPDGRWIAFWGLDPGSASHRDLFVVAADGSMAGAGEAIAITDDWPIDWSPEWSPDGRWLYFTSSRGGTFNAWRIAIDPATGRAAGEPRELTAPSSMVGALSLSADGRRMIFTDVNFRQRLRYAPLAGGSLAGPPRYVPTGSLELYDRGAESSPDGTELLGSTQGLPQHLLVINADGSGVRKLTDGPHRDRQASWSPDGEWIVFQSDRFPESGLALIHADGSGLRPVGAPPFGGWGPSWSPDGRHVAFCSKQGTYVVEPLAEDPAATLEALPSPGDGLNFCAVGFSPDGRQLVGFVLRGGVQQSIVLYSFATRSFETVEAISESLADGSIWVTPNFAGNRTLVWQEPQRLVLHDLDTGRSRTILESDSDGMNHPVDVSAGYDSIAWLEVADESDIWLVTFDR